MIQFNQKDNCTVVVVSLDECPWLRDTNVQLPGYVFKEYTHTLGSIRSCQLDHGITMRCYESVTNAYVVHLYHSYGVDADDKVRAIQALQQWTLDLETPKSCKIDLRPKPTTFDGYW